MFFKNENKCLLEFYLTLIFISQKMVYCDPINIFVWDMIEGLMICVKWVKISFFLVSGQFIFV